MRSCCAVLVSCCMMLTSVAGTMNKPHIIFILADDLGWNDVGFTGRSDLQTPNMDALAYHGRILTQHYALPTCTPSRTALLTGKYPIRTGMQGAPLLPNEARGLPLDQKLMPQYFKDLGYQTHLVGKWHLGHHTWRHTPLARGFDSHFGYFVGYIGYYSHSVRVANSTVRDFWRNAEPVPELHGRYVTDVLTEEAERLIQAASREPSRPLFLLLSHLAPHAGNPGEEEFRYPEHDLERFTYIPDENRRKYAAVVWNLDLSVGRVVDTLATSGMLNNTIIVLASDNGAPTKGNYFANGGSNFPLRGLKFTVFEGAVRSPAAVWSSQLHAKRLGASNQLFHFTDWLPTLYEAAGGDVQEVSGEDGRSQWIALQQRVERAESAVRQEMLLNIDEVTTQQAVRYRQWKLLTGTFLNGSYDHHYEDYISVPRIEPHYNTTQTLTSPASQALSGLYTGPLEVLDPLVLRQQVAVHCPPQAHVTPCLPAERAPCLFDLSADPCERNNVAAKHPNLITVLTAKLDTYREMLKPQIKAPRYEPYVNPVDQAEFRAALRAISRGSDALMASIISLLLPGLILTIMS